MTVRLSCFLSLLFIGPRKTATLIEDYPPFVDISHDKYEITPHFFLTPF